MSDEQVYTLKDGEVRDDDAVVKVSLCLPYEEDVEVTARGHDGGDAQYGALLYQAAHALAEALGGDTLQGFQLWAMKDIAGWSGGSHE